MRLLRSLVITAALAVPLSASAHPDLDAARQAMANGDFRGALVKLDAAERSPELSDEERVDVHWNRGVIQATMGSPQKAEKSFDEVLRLRPLYTPNRLETPPEIREIFARRAAEYQKTMGIRLGTPVFDKASVVVKLEGKVSQASRFLVFARASPQSSYSKFEFPITDTEAAAGVLNDRDLWLRTTSGKMEVVLEIRNSRGVPLARAGDAIAPVVMHVSPVQKERALTALSAMAEPPPAAPVVTTPPPAAERPAPRPAEEKPPVVAVVVPPPAQPPPPASEPPSTTTTTTTTATVDPPARPPELREGSPDEQTQAAPPKFAALRPVGAVLIGGAGVLGLVALAALAGTVGSGVLFGLANFQLRNTFNHVGDDKNSARRDWETAYMASQVAAAAFGVFGALVVVVALLPLGAGVVALVMSALG